MRSPPDVASLLGKRFACSRCGGGHHVPTELVASRKGMAAALPGILRRFSPGRSVLVLSDDITHGVAASGIAGALKTDGWQVSEVVLRPKGAKTVHAEDRDLPAILQAAQRRELILTVGAGSVTDLGKLAGSMAGKAVACFPTAPSMNAYTSGIAALIKEGLKVTLPVRPAVAVLSDTEILRQAPLDLIRAGFADSTAKAFANADWKLSSILTGERFCPLPLELVNAGEQGYLAKGRRLPARDERFVDMLMEGLHRGGISMVLAGSSSPASGGEHLLSHYLDMHAHEKKREPFAYHGLQVGVGVLVAAGSYERLASLGADEVGALLAARRAPDYEAEAKEAFPGTFAVVWPELEKKLPVLRALPETLPKAWDRIMAEVFPMTLPRETVRGYLTGAGCPIRFKEVGVSTDLARRAVRHSRLIRGRLTVLDIAAELGLLEDDVPETR